MSRAEAPSRRYVSRALFLAAAGFALRPLAARAATLGERADRVLVIKCERRLVLLRRGRPLASFPVALGFDPIGAKFERGDGRTPEGLYRVDWRNAHSRYHRALHLSYPNPADIRRARAAGVAPGGDIEIHGLPDRFGDYDPHVFYRDWTNGCIAVCNPAIDEIWASVPLGTPVEIRA